MKKFIGIILAITALEAGIIGVGSGAVHASTIPGQAITVVSTERCVHDPVNGGSYCGHVELYPKGTVIRHEGYTLRPNRRAIYQGLAYHNLSNGRHVVTVPSKVKPGRFQTYRLR